MQEKSVDKQSITLAYPGYEMAVVDRNLDEALKLCRKKVIVLDDDPTGVQTVHGIHVYTDWTRETIKQAFEEPDDIFFILTNSRGFTQQETIEAHKAIAENILQASKENDTDFILISRGDSTLRGHYPLETQVLKETIEQNSDKRIDGEVLFPFFLEGGRLTIENVHYVEYGDLLVPAGETEFAGDKTFGYTSSHLGEWIEEKSEGIFGKESIVYIGLDELRALNYEKITQKLKEVKDFHKIVVNAIDYGDVKVFVTALMYAILQDKNFLFRSAASLTKVIGGIGDKPLLTAQDFPAPENKNGGLILVGSHVRKTTVQMEYLQNAGGIEFVEFNQHLVIDEEAFEKERNRVMAVAEKNILQNRTVAIYTRRERLDVNTGNNEDELRIAAKISDGITSIVQQLKVRPSYIIAKGGITSSDIGTKGLCVKKALVLGQILKGIPVWLTGEESKFPNMPFIIFPGNVGSETALLDVVKTMEQRRGEKKEE